MMCFQSSGIFLVGMKHIKMIVKVEGMGHSMVKSLNAVFYDVVLKSEKMFDLEVGGRYVLIVERRLKRSL